MPAGGNALPGLGGGPVHTVGPIGLFDEKGMHMVMRSNFKGRVAVKFDPPGDCKACRQLDKVWDMLAAERPGAAWRVNCGEHLNVCVLRQVNAENTLSPDLIRHPKTGQMVRAKQSSMQIWDGREKVFYRYVGER